VRSLSDQVSANFLTTTIEAFMNTVVTVCSPT